MTEGADEMLPKFPRVEAANFKFNVGWWVRFNDGNPQSKAYEIINRSDRYFAGVNSYQLRGYMGNEWVIETNLLYVSGQ